MLSGPLASDVVSGDVLVSIGERLRAARERCGYTLEGLATITGFSKAHLSRLESAERQPSIASLLICARALVVPVSWLLGEEEALTPLAIHTGQQARHEVAGLLIAPCSGYSGSSQLEALRMTIPHGRPLSPPARHSGEEWLYVLSGAVRLDYDGGVHELVPGRAAHFDAGRPHRMVAVGVDAEVLIVAASGSSGLRSAHR